MTSSAEARARAGLADPARRRLLAAGAASALGVGAAAAGEGAAAVSTRPFDFETVVDLARRRALEPGEAPARQGLRGVFANLSFEDYHAIRVRPEARLWRGAGLGFEVDLLPPGAIWRDRVAIHVVEDGAARPLPFDAAALDFGDPRFGLADGQAPAGDAQGLDWTGFRLRAPLNRPDLSDPFALFQGASFFRAVGRDQRFGCAARGLAIGTGSAEGEEFPVFTAFWLRRPEPGASELRFYALLESASLTGAYAFAARPGAETVMDVRAALFPRATLREVGLAPLTSMYFFGPKDRFGVDDYRDAVHDSDGLQMLTGRGERLWRPLANPATLQLSTFVDADPQGFGFAQRPRAFPSYQDAQARFDKRPSAWIAPGEGWGEGGVGLVEIPTETEFNDNVVAFWRPDAPLQAGTETRVSYRLYWSDRPPDEAPLARIAATRAGRAAGSGGARLMVVDFETGDRALDALAPDCEARGAELLSVALQPLPQAGRARAEVAFRPPETGAIEFRLRLVDAGDGAPASETWLYRWTPA